MSAFLRRFALPTLMLAAIAIPATGADDPGRLAPADTLLLVSLTDLSTSKARLSETSWGDLCRDEAMKPFVESIEKGVPRLIEEKIKEAWRELEIDDDAPTDLPWPTGQITTLLRLKRGQRQVVEYDWEEYDGQGEPPVKARRMVPTTQVRGVLLVDLGENAPDAKRLTDRLVRAAADQGWRRRREEVRGNEMTLLSPPKADADEDEDVVEPSERSLIYAFRESTLLLCLQAEESDFAYCGDLLARLGGAERPSLADDADYRRLTRKVGEGDLVAYFNVKHLLRWTIDQSEGMQKAQTASMMNVLGVENLTGFAASVRLAADERKDVLARAVLGIEGPRRGIPAIVLAEPRSTQPGALLTKGLSGFMVANYDLGVAYDRVREIVQQAGAVDIDMLAAQAMAETAVDGGSPINLRKDLLERLTGPIVLLMQIRKPYTSSDASSWELNVGVRDSAALDSTLGRLHAMAFDGDKEARRELRGRNVYLMGTPTSDSADSTMAFAVADGNLLFGLVKVVEQGIRSLGREDVSSISEDPMYRHVARYLPARASIYSYENQQDTAGPMWEQFRQLGRDSDESEEDDDEATSQVSFGLTGSGIFADGFGKKYGEYVDFGLLPEFDRIRKLWGAAVGYVTDCDEGIWMESVVVKPPAE
jgi:hypothetical protein